MGDCAPETAVRRLDPGRAGDHVDRLFRAAWALCGSREDAEDLVQDVYAKVLARPRWLRNEDDLGYLLRALHNLHVSRLRTRRRRAETVPIDAVPELADPRAFRLPELSAEVGELFAGIARLPSPFREALVAVDVAGLSYAEAASALHTPEATIATRVHRARRRVVADLTNSTLRGAAS